MVWVQSSPCFSNLQAPDNYKLLAPSVRSTAEQEPGSRTPDGFRGQVLAVETLLSCPLLCKSPRQVFSAASLLSVPHSPLSVELTQPSGLGFGDFFEIIPLAGPLESRSGFWPGWTWGIGGELVGTGWAPKPEQ